MHKYDDRWATLAITISFLTEELTRHKNISLSSHRIKEGLKHQWQKQGILVFINLTLHLRKWYCRCGLWKQWNNCYTTVTSNDWNIDFIHIKSLSWNKKTRILNLISGITLCNISSSQQIHCRFEKRNRNEDFFFHTTCINTEPLGHIAQLSSSWHCQST